MKSLFALFVLIPMATYANESRYVVRVPENSQIQSNLPSKPGKRLKHFNGKVLQLTAKEARQLKDQGYEVEKDGLMTIQGEPSYSQEEEGSSALATKQPVPWGIKAVKALEANQYPSGSGSGVTVCVVDSGVDYTHPALDGQVIGGEGIVKTTIPNRLDYFDDKGHGTHVSGTVAGKWTVLRGVAPLAKIYAVKVLNSRGSGYHSDIAEGIKSCIGKSQVINLSLGGGSYSKIIHDALKAAKAAGMEIACAAGNGGGSVIYPARNPECSAITAVDKYKKIASFSSRGPEVDFAAPGVGVRSTIPGGGYGTWNGTSMATPHASGVMAIMFSRKKTAPIKATSIGLTATQQGAGQVDALKTTLGK